MRPFGPDSPWRLNPAITFLNHGSFGACPEPVLLAQRALMDALEADPIQFLWRDYLARLDEARAEVATFLDADPEGLVVVPNATTGVSTILRSLRFRPGDELLTTDHEYNATLNALRKAADDSRATVVQASIPLPIRHAEEIVEALIARVTPRTRIALVSHVTSATGLVFPIESVVRELDRLGVDTIVDAAHAPGMVPVDVTALNAAYWTTNGHKWLCGPKGTGVLHVRADRRDGISPLVTSHGRNDPRTDRPRLWKEFDWQGTGDPTAFFAVPEALRVVGSLDPAGWPGLMAANHALAVAARTRIEAALGVESIAPEHMVGSMAALRLPTLSTEDEAAALNLAMYREDGIEASVHAWPVPAARTALTDTPKAILVRVSAQRYNEASDFDRLADALVRRGLASASPRPTRAAPRLS